MYVASQGAAHALGSDPALTAGLLDHIECAAGIQAHLLRHRHGFCCAREIDGSEQVVDQLRASAIANALAHMEQV